MEVTECIYAFKFVREDSTQLFPLLMVCKAVETRIMFGKHFKLGVSSGVVQPSAQPLAI